MYKIIRLPIRKPFHEFSSKEAKYFLEWYIFSIDERLAVLQSFIGDEFELAKDISIVPKLDKWARNHITIQELTPKDREMMLKNKPDWFVKADLLESWRLTEESISLTIDIGMFLSQLFLANIPSLNWHIITRAKKHADYNQPVLKGEGKIMCNPTSLVRVYASSHISSRSRRRFLKEVYEIWFEILSGKVS